jgi:tyrosyl-tRNA synthetase
MNKTEKIDSILRRNVEEIIPLNNLKEQLKGRKVLRVKLGIDPTSPDLHIGRAVVLWKLRAFQDLGHKAILIVGDFTGLIGDASDKDSERPMLSKEEVKKNAATYFKQAFKILDPKKTETYFNSKWLKKLDFLEIGKMADQFSLHEFIARENIKKRLDAGKRIGLREVLYPLMQGYDSIAIKADVELGGTDQRFNLLAGRTLQPAYGQPAQTIMTTTLLEGLDGRKMSSSWGNTINLTDTAENMFGKIMSLPDSLIEKYFLFATPLEESAIKKILAKSRHPRDQKLELARAITGLYHGSAAAEKAANNFIARFSNKELPANIPTKKVKAGSHQLSALLFEVGLASSKSEARRLIAQNGVKVNQGTAKDILIETGSAPILLQVGKRKLLYVK